MSSIHMSAMPNVFTPDSVGGLRNRIREEREQSHQMRRLSLRRSLRGQGKSLEQLSQLMRR